MSSATGATVHHTRVQQVMNLPPLPALAPQLLAEFSNPEVDIPILAGLIERDPGLTARVVGVANSAYFSHPEPIYTVSEAIIRVLGLNLVKGLALGVILSSPFETRSCPRFPLDRYWYCAMLTAHLARRLGPAAGLPGEERDALFLGGLLHSLGQLVLAHLFPAPLNEVYIAAPGTNIARRALQRDLIGIDEVEAGALLGRKWHLPPAVVAVMTGWQNSAYDGPHQPLVRLVGYCADLAERCHDAPETVTPDNQPEPPPPLRMDTSVLTRVLNDARARDDDTRALARTLAGH